MTNKLKGQNKRHLHDFCNEASCGESLYLADANRAGYDAQALERYRLEPYIESFAGFSEARGLRVLEIGVGLGADHQHFAESGVTLYGIDLTERAIEHTRQRLSVYALQSNLIVGDAEALDFSDEEFDRVYSWGVLHHSPDTPKAISEVYRVLKNDGRARIMIYNKWSMIGLMLWLRYALLDGRPLQSLSSVYAQHLESPGAKAQSVAEAKQVFSMFSEVSISTVLTHGDLLESQAGQRHKGALLSFARKIWPRGLLKLLFPNAGLFMLIEAKK